MYFHFRSVRISFISKVTRVHKAMTVVNNTSLYSTILAVFLEFIPVDRAENNTEFVPVTKPARLLGSYEEALSNGNLAELCGIYEWKAEETQPDQPNNVVLYVGGTCIFRQPQKLVSTITGYCKYRNHKKTS